MKQYRFKINGNEYNVAINSIDGNNASVTVNGKDYMVELEDSASVQTFSAPQAPAVPVVTTQSPASPIPEAGSGKAVTSPRPGVIISVNVKVGDPIKAGQEVAVLEAMKMENSIEATHDGTVTAVHVSKGDSIPEGAPIVTIG